MLLGVGQQQLLLHIGPCTAHCSTTTLLFCKQRADPPLHPFAGMIRLLVPYSRKRRGDGAVNPISGNRRPQGVGGHINKQAFLLGLEPTARCKAEYVAVGFALQHPSPTAC